MLFAIDIDQTIAGSQQDFRLYIEHHNQDLGLGLSPHTINTLTDYHSFLHLPEVIVYRSHNEARFQASRASCRTSPYVINALQAIPDAAAGVTYLSQYGTIYYYTIRLPEIQNATKQWLAAKRFPYPNNIVFCTDSMHKLTTLCEQKTTEERIVLIDDKCATLLKAFDILAEEQPHIAESLRRHLTLVAFNTKVSLLPIHNTGLKVIALPSWKAIIDIINSLQLHSFVPKL